MDCISTVRPHDRDAVSTRLGKGVIAECTGKNNCICARPAVDSVIACRAYQSSATPIQSLWSFWVGLFGDWPPLPLERCRHW